MHKVERQANELHSEIIMVWNLLIRRPLRLFKFSFLGDKYGKNMNMIEHHVLGADSGKKSEERRREELAGSLKIEQPTGRTALIFFCPCQFQIGSR
jgi:hypothetical protein